MNPFDQAVMGLVQGYCHNGVSDRIFPVITYLGEGGAVWIALALLLVVFGKKSGWRGTGVVMLGAMLAGLVIGEICLKNLIGRPRPFQEAAGAVQLLIAPPAGWSFPSGHSCASFGAAVGVFRRDKRWGAAALALAGLIAFSRVFLFVHYPTDVLAGAALGCLCAWGAGYCQRRACARRGI
ncbi:phosphatase PAP2 family protein [Acutalibacter caecimuris]|uniref:phosphatase PAP2 family protein n=1 Tax=Acutalibacter caecimuris TaxID=3093657 RepID=UPI002AC8E82D|nr:phosphatase PAP2 family protein [Acutalibacter sp. M00118]